jgi:hypothetical protein
MNNLPATLPKVEAFAGKPFAFTLGFPEGYAFDNPTALIEQANGRLLPEVQQPTVAVDGQQLRVTLPATLTGIAYSLLYLWIFNAGEGILGTAVEVAERIGRGGNQPYQVRIITGETVQVIF